MPNPIAYDIILRSLSDNTFIEILNADADGTLTKEGIESADRPALIQIIQWAIVGRALQGVQFEAVKKQQEMLEAQTTGTLRVATAMKDGLEKTLGQINEAFESTMIMYKISFYLGVILIIAALLGAFLLKETILSVIFGSLDILDILTFFLAKPQEKLQSSRASLAQMQAALYNWFTDAINQNTYLGLQRDKIDMATMQSVSESLITHTDKTLEMLQKCKVS